MKKLLICFVLLTVIFITGCDNNKGNTIVGKWTLGSYVYTFNEDGTCSYVGYGNLMECTYTTDGDNISILYKGNTAPFETKFYIDGDALNIVDSFDEPTYYKKQK